MNGTIASVGDIGGSTPTPTPTYKIKCTNGRLMFFVDVNVNTITTFAELAQYIANNGCISNYLGNNDQVIYEVATLATIPSFCKYAMNVDPLTFLPYIKVERYKAGDAAWSNWTPYVGILRVDIKNDTSRFDVRWIYANDTSGDWSVQYV